MNFPSGENATPFTLPIKPLNSCINSPFKFHHLTVLSLAPVRMIFHREQNATEITWNVCPKNSRISFPSIVLELCSKIIGATGNTYLPSGEICKGRTRILSLPPNSRMSFPFRSNNFGESSQLPIRISFPSGENATAEILPCSFKFL